jgi:hypothetical protein
LRDRRVDRVRAFRDVPRPRFERERIVKSEVARFDRAPGQPGANDELRAGWGGGCCEEEQQRGGPRRRDAG